MKDNVANNKTVYTYEITDTGGTHGPDRLTDAITNASGGTGALVDKYHYDYDKNGNIKEADQHRSGAGARGQDELRLQRGQPAAAGSTPAPHRTSCNSTPTGGETYRYDLNGNQTIGTGGRTYTYNAKNQTSAIGATSLTYIGDSQYELTGIGSTSLENNPLGVGISTTSGTSTYYVREPNGAPICDQDWARHAGLLHHRPARLRHRTDQRKHASQQLPLPALRRPGQQRCHRDQPAEVRRRARHRPWRLPLRRPLLRPRRRAVDADRSDRPGG